MSEPAATPPRMTVAEFLKWDDGTDTSYELIDGRPVARYARSGRSPIPTAMAPPAPRHGRIAMNTGGAIDGRLKDRLPCGSVGEGGVWVNDETCYIPDVVATCVPLSDEGYVADPFLVVEILSNSDRGKRAREKVDGYMTLPSVQEIWLVDSRKRWLQQWRRAGEDSWIVGLPLTGPATFASPTLGGEPVALDELYFNTGL